MKEDWREERGVSENKPKHEGAIEEVVEDLMEDPDSPENSDGREPPQTIDAEPESERKTR